MGEDTQRQTHVLDGVYVLKKKIGKGGMAVVYLADVDLDRFDYLTLYAYTQVQGATHAERRKNAEGLAEELRGRTLDLATMRSILEAQKIPMPGKQVAIKVATGDCEMERFEAEWKNLLCLNHPNVIKVYGGGIYQRRAYYAMELLEDMVSPKSVKASLVIKDKLRIIIEGARGLQYLHDNGLIHRDIKPDNMVTCKRPEGGYITRVTDLGLGKSHEEDLGLTSSRTILGSPSYMSPEQISCTRDVDHRADIYSMGASMYELVCGVRPYHNKSTVYELISCVSQGEPPVPVQEHAPHLPPVIIQIIDTAMRYEPGERYQSVGDMADDIEQYLRQESPDLTMSLSFEQASGAESTASVGGSGYHFEQAGQASQAVAASVHSEVMPVESKDELQRSHQMTGVAQKKRRAVSVRGKQRAAADAAKTPWALWGGIAGVVVVLIVGLIVWGGGGAAPEASVETANAESTIPEPQAEPQPPVAVSERVPSVLTELDAGETDGVAMVNETEAEDRQPSVAPAAGDDSVAKASPETVEPEPVPGVYMTAEEFHAALRATNPEYADTAKLDLSDEGFVKGAILRPKSQVRDLSGLRGVVLDVLILRELSIDDLSPLAPVPPKRLSLEGSTFPSLTPLGTASFVALSLKGVDIKGLSADALPYAEELDLPLAGMALITDKASKRLGATTVYDAFPLTAQDAHRQQVETARALGIPVRLTALLPEEEEIELMLIPAGQCMMGLSTEQVARLRRMYSTDRSFVNFLHEMTPQHRVTITKPFYLARHETTVGVWNAMVPDAAFENMNKALPAHPLSYNAIVEEFLQALIRRARMGDTSGIFSLPSEAQWEYACRAGTDSLYAFTQEGDAVEAYAWTKENSGGVVHAVGQKAANAWGLYDMHGNVWEWCRDWFMPNYYRVGPPVDPENTRLGLHRLLRGGNWQSHGGFSSSIFRGRAEPGKAAGSPGFRIALEMF